MPLHTLLSSRILSALLVCLCEHAVALLERTIFDNNHPHGLPLSRESLDYVLQRSRCVEDSFSHVRRAVRLMAGQSPNKAYARLLGRESEMSVMNEPELGSRGAASAQSRADGSGGRAGTGAEPVCPCHVVWCTQ